MGRHGAPKVQLKTVALPADYVDMCRNIAWASAENIRDVVVRCSSPAVQKEYARIVREREKRLRSRQVEE